MIRRFSLLLFLFVTTAFRSFSNSEYETALPANADTASYALVAGGSKGIGYAIAEALAKRHFNLILIARHTDSLVAAKERLETAYGIRVEFIKKDLTAEHAAEEIAAWCKEKNLRIKMLCNVAGFGGARDYLSLPIDSVRYMTRLNTESPMTLIMAMLPFLEQSAPSYILNVGSMAGFAPIPVKNAYSATKAALISFSYALRYQLKGKNISVSCLCPGPVYTKPSIKEDTEKKLGWFGKKMAVSPAKVGEKAVKKTLKGRMMIIPGTLPKVTSFFIRVLPKRWITSIYYGIGG